MLKKFFMGAVTLFWIGMNVALWRVEYGAAKQGGSVIPMDLVWEKLLTAPDSSGLAVLSKGKRIGFFRWTPTVKEPVIGTTGSTSESYVEGMVKEPLGYLLHLEGSLSLPNEESTRIRLEWRLDLKNEEDWKEVYFSLDNRKLERGVELSMQSESDELELRFGGTRDRTTVTVTRDELQNPAKLLNRFGMGWAAPMIQGMAATAAGGLGGAAVKQTEESEEISRIPLSLALKWDARMDWKMFGRSRVRVYRLTAQILEGEEMTLIVSRVGEIIEGSLPGGITFQNDQLLGL